MNNTIILLKGTETLTKMEYRRFEKGDTIWGLDQEPEELKRWNIDQKEEAEKALADLRCEYIQRAEIVDITEYALQYCECNEDGDFIQGSDYDLAPEEGEKEAEIMDIWDYDENGELMEEEQEEEEGGEEEMEKKIEVCSYVYGMHEFIEIGETYYFGELWDGEDGDGEELLESGSVSPDNENVVKFAIIEKDEDDLLQTRVKVTDIY